MSMKNWTKKIDPQAADRFIRRHADNRQLPAAMANNPRPTATQNQSVFQAATGTVTNWE